MRNEYLDILTKLINLIDLDDLIIKQLKKDDVNFLLHPSTTYISNSDRVRLKNLWTLV